MWWKIPLIVILLFIGFVSFVWFSEDSIGKVAISSKFILATEPLRDPKSIALFFEKYHGEAPSHAAMINLASWCIDNPERCNKLLVLFNDETIKRLKWAAKDSGQLNEMNIFFNKHETKNDS